MQTINILLVDGVICPISPFPESSVKIVFNGTEYVIYEEGDELPPEPVYDEQL